MASIWTASELEEQLAAYKAALLALSTSQSYRVGTRELTRADLPEIRETLDYLAREKARLVSGSSLASVSMRPRRS